MATIMYREKEIRAAEERLLEEDIPRTADEFEKMVRSSPNSSFIWIKYMDFMISMADVEKARSIAERYFTFFNPFVILKSYLLYLLSSLKYCVWVLDVESLRLKFNYKTRHEIKTSDLVFLSTMS